MITRWLGVPNNWGLPQKGAQLLHVRIAAIRSLMPTMWMTRVRLWARTLSAISAATFGSVFVRKCVAPMRALIVLSFGGPRQSAGLRHIHPI